MTKSKREDSDFVDKLVSYDIIFLYESWLNKETEVNLSGFTCLNFPRKFQNRRAKRNSGGITVFFRNSLRAGIIALKNRFDALVWLRLKKDFFGFPNDIYIAGTYIWCENSPAYDIHNVDLFQLLEEDINFYDNLGTVYVIGGNTT